MNGVTMRISAFPKGDLPALAIERSMTVFEWIEKAKALPVEGLELYSGMFWQTDTPFVDSVGEALTDAGFEMPMLCHSPDFTHPDSEVRKREFDNQVEMMEITAQLGGRGASTRVLSGQRYPEVSLEQGVEWVIETYKQLIPIAIE